MVFDRDHLMVMAGEAVDAVRKRMQREGANLKGNLWALRGNEWSLKPEQKEIPATLSQRYKALGPHLGAARWLQDIYEAPKEEGIEAFRLWYQWASRSKLEPLEKLARTVTQYWNGIVAYFNERITQGAIEAINGIIQLAKRRARGYRNFAYLRTIAYWNTGKLKPHCEGLLPT